MAKAKPQGGATANVTGAKLEDQIHLVLESLGYEFLGYYPDVEVASRLMTVGQTRPAFVRQHGLLARDLYGRNNYIDFVLVHPAKFPGGLAIEAKSQHSTGSADRKLTDLGLVMENYGMPGMVIYDGTGAQEGLAWLESRIGLGSIIAVVPITYFARTPSAWI